MNYYKQTINTMIALIFLFIIGCMFDILPVNFVIKHNNSCFYYMILSIGLFLYFKNSIIDRKTCIYLTLVSSMIVLWFVIRFVKYQAFAESDYITRKLWYAYYIPMLFIPQFSLGTAMGLAMMKIRKGKAIMAVTGIITFVFTVVILTNDVHHLIFIFENGFVKDLQNYSYGILFWIITVWSYLLLAASIILIVLKSPVAQSLHISWILVLYSSLFVTWLIFLSLDMRPKIAGHNLWEFPETVCFLVGGLWLLCLKAGLVPCNKGYGRIFSATSLSAIITDADYKVAHKSKSAVSMTKEQLKKDETFLLNENTRVYKRPVSGGFAYLQVDLTELNDVNKKLDDVREALDEEKEIIRLENELKQKRAEIDAKSKTYDNIAVAVLPQLKKIEEFVNLTHEKPLMFTENMQMVAIYICYIKRMSNLMLMASESEKLSREELKLSFWEIVRYVNKAGIFVDINCDEENLMLPSKVIVSSYAAFFNIFESALSDVKAISIILIKDVLKITIEGAKVDLPENILGTCEIEDEISFIKIYLGEEKKI